MFKAYIFLLLFLMVSGCLAEKRGETQADQLDKTIVEIASQQPEVASIINNSGSNYEIRIINPENISQLSEKFPVIYGKLPNKTLYILEYKGEKGILVIIDLENSRVLRYFKTTGVIIK